MLILKILYFKYMQISIDITWNIMTIKYILDHPLLSYTLYVFYLEERMKTQRAQRANEEQFLFYAVNEQK